MTDYEQLEITSREQWRAWLSDHGGDRRGVWVVTHKKGAGRPWVPYDDVVDEAVAHGWIDSQPRSLDDERSQLLVTPRNPRSNWSRRNKERVERLLAEGRMAPAGLDAVEQAKRDGTWTALDDVESLREPDDLAAALDAAPDARRYWDAFPRSTKRGILEWIAAAKRPETRAARVTTTAEQAAQNVRANQWRQPKG